MVSQLHRRSSRLFTSALLVAAVGCGDTVTDPNGRLDILFVGNSLTYFNSLPLIVGELMDAAGSGPHNIEMVAYGGYGLEDHWTDGNALRAIQRGGWDYIVLQQGPSATEGRPSLLEYTRRFGEEADKIDARIALYMVWPDTQRFFDFDGVSQSYRMAAEEVDGLLLPVGDAWRAAWLQNDQLPLYGPDGFHPSPMGSYLAALVMFQRFTNLSPVGLPSSLNAGPDHIEVPEGTALLLQQAAAQVSGGTGPNPRRFSGVPTPPSPSR